MKVNIRSCPQCRSSKIILHAAGFDGLYECTSCGYIGPVVLEEEKDIS